MGSVVGADSREHPDPAVDVERWSSLAEAALAHEGVTGELSLTFVDDDEIAALNAEHMGKQGPTDVLSFPIDGADRGAVQPGVPVLLGDVVISPAVASRQFDTHAGTFDDEIALLVVHGVLHVLGHDHAEAAQAEVMRARERLILERCHWHGPAPEEFRQTHE